MHPNSQHMLAMANSFWPFSYPLKSYDMTLHPAFLQTAYRGIPTLSYGQQFDPVQSQTNSPSPPQKSSSSDKFSIDAILNKDKDKEISKIESVPAMVNEQKSFTSYVKYTKDDDVIKRRHQRLLEATHPYLSHHGSLQDKNFLQKHLQSTYKQFNDTVRTPEKDRKPSQCGESWTGGKPGKGKRVRTIFTPEQLERMEAEFERQQYMVGTERYYLASSLNLTEAQVKVWFQNRRIKWRKQHLEQQQAKLKSLNMYRQAESTSDSDSEDDVITGSGDIMVERDHDSIADPFQSPKESRGTQ